MKKHHRWTLVIAILHLALLLSLFGCGQESAPPRSPASSDAMPGDVAQPPLPSEETSEMQSEASSSDRDVQSANAEEATSAIDGIIVEGEYARTKTIADVELHWSTDEDTLTMAIAAPCTGYVTVGFDPDNRKEGGNYIIGYVKDGIAIVRDHVGTRGNLHDADVNLGGENNLLAYAGSEADGWTTLEFVIPLDSGDDMDKPLVPGNKHIVLVAYQSHQASAHLA